MNTIAISDFRTQLPALINEVDTKFKRFIITVSGKPKAVVLNLEELESLEETADILSLPSALESIKEARKQVKKGKVITLKNLKKKYQL